MARPHKTSRPALKSAEQRRAVMQLRLQGKSFEAIGRALGISRQRAHAIAKDEIEKSIAETQQDTAAYRQLHVERIEAMIGIAWTFVKPASDRGPASATPAALQAIDRVNRLLERQAKLLGLDRPTAMELSGPDGGPLPIDYEAAAAAVYPDPPASPKG